MTQAEDDIKTRFFQALDFLKDQKAIRGLGTFCRAYNLDRARLSKIKNNLYGFHTIEAVWIAYLADYGISPEWVITGKGKMYFTTQKRDKITT